jgi:hypothetical protein
MSLDTYQHVMDELEGVERVPAEEQIRRARASLVPVSYPLSDADEAAGAVGEAKALVRAASRRSDSNRGPLHYERGGDGEGVPRPTANPEQLDEGRPSVGLEPCEQYVAQWRGILRRRAAVSR